MTEKSKRIPERMCVGCRAGRQKNQLIRIVCNKNGDISIDEKGKKEGRGAYICNCPECLEKALKNKGLNRAFKREVPKEVIEVLMQSIKEQQDNI